MGTAARRGFTLAELLVVMSIILTLVGLLISAVTAVRNRANEAKVRSDISQLTSSVGQFKGDYSAYPPTHLVLSNNYAVTANNGNPPTAANVTPAMNQNGTAQISPAAQTGNMIADSEAFLKKMFPRWSSSPAGGGTNGIPVAGNAGSYKIISGSQVLVFLLGGYHVDSATKAGVYGLGFSDDPQYPFGTAPASSTKKPYYDFPAARQIQVMTQMGPGANAADTTFFAFADPFGVPFVYFGSSVSNDYGDSVSALTTYPPPSATAPAGYLMLPTLNYSLGGGIRVQVSLGSYTLDNVVNPYIDTTGKFVNPLGNQFVSAGADGGYFLKYGAGHGGFGQGGATWNPANTGYSAQYVRGSNSGFGFDDISNFSGSQLGVR